MKRRLLIGLTALCVLLTGPLVDAVARAIVVPIPGLSGGEIQLAGALRTNDGGGILAARLSNGPASARGHIVLARLQADGALNLAYGTRGLSTLRVDSRLQPTALAIDPTTGQAWIGGRIGQSGAGEIVAVDARGNRDRSFGGDGVLRLPAADDGGPVALAWTPRSLLISAGRAPCRGCSVSIRNPATGRVTASFVLSPTNLAPAGCGAAVTGAILVNSHTEYVTTSTTNARGCNGMIVALGQNLHPLGVGGPAAPSLRDPLAHWSQIASLSGSTCAAASDPSKVEISALNASSAIGPTIAPAGALLTLVPLGPGSCAALIKISDRDTTVAQMNAGNRRALINRLPAGVTPLSMFRCHQHLLVVGATGRAGHRSAVIVPVPVRSGRFARQASIASAHMAMTGCQRSLR